MTSKPLNIVFLGLSITSSWGNGHATTYRALLRELAKRGHRLLFLERDVPWYADTRDSGEVTYAQVGLYRTLDELQERFRAPIAEADAVVVGSYVPEGVAVAEWLMGITSGIAAFYDIDTPVTLAKVEQGGAEYLSAELISRYQLYLSFTGGPILDRIATEFKSPMARPLYCSVDPEIYYPEAMEKKWDLGFLGTFSPDRQPALQRLLCEPASRWPGGRFAVAGSQYPACIQWPPNVERIHHLPPSGHRQFYNQQCFTLNLTRSNMIEAGYSPSVRLFEAAACGVPIISDYWEGLEEFFEIGDELLVTRSAEETLMFLRSISSGDRQAIGEAGRRRVLTRHTAAHRAAELEGYLVEAMARRSAPAIQANSEPAHTSNGL
jgi:spore maturation protein CgeB